jgi:hypothetical protein
MQVSLMKKNLALLLPCFLVFTLQLAGCSIPMANVSTSSQAPDASLSNESSDSVAEFLGKRNELPYYSIDGGVSIVADEYEREVLHQVVILEKAAYLYGLAKASGDPETFLSQEMEEWQLVEAKLPESFGNTALIDKQMEIVHLTEAVQLAREHSAQDMEFFPSQEDFVR